MPAGGGGTFLGGFLVNKCRLRGAGVVKLCALCTLTSLLATFVFFVQCPNVPMVGVTADYNGRSGPGGTGGWGDTQHTDREHQWPRGMGKVGLAVGHFLERVTAARHRLTVTQKQPSVSP